MDIGLHQHTTQTTVPSFAYACRGDDGKVVGQFAGKAVAVGLVGKGGVQGWLTDGGGGRLFRCRQGILGRMTSGSQWEKRSRWNRYCGIKATCGPRKSSCLLLLAGGAVGLESCAVGCIILEGFKTFARAKLPSGNVAAVINCLLLLLFPKWTHPEVFVYRFHAFCCGCSGSILLLRSFWAGCTRWLL